MRKKLRKIAKKLDQVYFCQYKLNGKIREFKITAKQYNGMGKNATIQRRIPNDGIYTGGYSRYDYDTLTGLLGDDEYGEDSEGFFQVKDSRGPMPFVVIVDKIIADEIEDDIEYRDLIKDNQGNKIL